LQIEATNDKSFYLQGEDITISISILNVSKSAFVVDPYVPEVTLRHFGGGNSEVRLFASGSDTKLLESGQTVSYTVMWDQRDNQEQQVPYGSYEVALDSFLTEPGVIFRVSAIRILPSQGAMENTIAINKTVAAANGTITLERITLRAAQIKINAIYTPQGYVMPTQSGTSSSQMAIDALAEYRVDDNSMKNAGPVFDQWSAKGIELTWIIFDTIPSDSTELSFRITQIEKVPEKNQWQGPWEFIVQLR
jgi:hypothetical protein